MSRIEWQQSANNTGEKRTSTFLQEMYDGVSCAMHYKSLGPVNFVPPLLHMEIGMVNQVWEDMEGWIVDAVKAVPEDERAACTSLLDAKEKLDEATRAKDAAKITISVEIREKKER